MLAQEIGIGTIITMLLGSGAVIAVLFKLLLASKDALITSKEREHALALQQLAAEKLEEEGRKKSYQEIGAEGLKVAKEIADFYRQKYEGKAPIIPVAPVVSESHSPSTAKQREAAAIATMRATMAQIKLEAGLEPRPEPEMAVESATHSPQLIKALNLEQQISEVPEKTATRVVEKIEESK